jgi:hypothetical protein
MTRCFAAPPGRGDAKYTGDRSAFDVFVEYQSPGGTTGFAGVEVKYHEALGDVPAPHSARYDELAAAMDCFTPGASDRLKKKPLQQIWRDHLLAGGLLADQKRGYADAFFAFLYPKDNAPCERAVDSYRGCLASETSFVPWTLESLVDAARAEGGGAWVESFAGRYLAFDRIDTLLASGSASASDSGSGTHG